MKSIILFINIILISLFNVLFRYFNVRSDLNSFNSNSSVVSGFITTSNVNVPYLKIFIFSFVLSGLLFLLIIFILKKCSGDSFFTVISKLNNLLVFIFIIISIILLQFNSTISFFVLIIGFILFLYYMYKEFCFKKYIYLICLILILYFLTFYFISF